MDNHVNDSIGGAHLFNGKNVDFVEDRFGRAKSAVRFSDGYYQVPPGVYFKGDFSISVWVKAINIPIAGGRIIDFGNGVSGPSDNVQFITSFGATAKPVFKIYLKQFETHLESSLPLIIGQWTHLVFTQSDSTGTLYMNGLKISQNSDMYIPRNVNRALNFIGKSYSDSERNLWMDLDDLQFYKKSMTQAEVNGLFLQQIKGQQFNDYK